MPVLTYVTPQMRAALAEHRLKQVCNANGVRVFRMAAPGGINAVNIAFLPDRIGIACAHGGIWSRPDVGLPWFLMAHDSRGMESFFAELQSDAVIGYYQAIQQRFAELYREREARIQEIVAGWEWELCDEPAVGTCYLGPSSDRSVAAAYANGDWLTSGIDGHGHAGTAELPDAAKVAARAAVLRQAKEHPELWHCGAVDE